MKKTKKIGVFLLVLVLIFQGFPLLGIAAENSAVHEEDTVAKKFVLFASNSEEVVPLLEEDDENSKVLTYIPDGSEIEMIEERSGFIKLSYTEKKSEQDSVVWNGFIKVGTAELIDPEEVEEFRENRMVEIDEEDESILQLDENHENTETGLEPDAAAEKENETNVSKNNDKAGEVSVLKPEEEQKGQNETQSIEKQSRMVLMSDSPVVPQSEVQHFQGLALKEPTHVYKNPARSEVLKSYSQGSILKYRSYANPDWYEATVYVNGKAHTGYIHKDDVEHVGLEKQVQYQGIALQNPTIVYQRASTGSKELKTYAQGSILKYRSFSSQWYEATVYVNGKKQTGYIHKSHVENLDIGKQVNYRGIGLQNPTRIYQRASTNSKVWKSYAQGSVLKYRSFSSQWYEATVYVNGKKQTGYIHKTHVENVVDKQESLKGLAIQRPTAVYQRASTASKNLKTYKAGTILIYKTFTKNWYEATVYINGKRTVGYIYKSHVEELASEIGRNFAGAALKSPTNVYAEPSRNSKILKGYKKSHILKYKGLSKNWYEATVYLNGKAYKGFINVYDVSQRYYTNYDISLKDFVDIQMKADPKSDGAGKISASKDEVEYYANPANFTESMAEYFQFLKLSTSAGLTAQEINNNLLKGAGILEGQGKAFVDAARKHNLNEVYLVIHAKHETGNGTSILARGVPVDKNGDVIRDEEGNIDYNQKNPRYYKTVYNMFGIGAVDNNVINGGAKTAFNNGWFTVYDAIVGGAKFIGDEYINIGQDTLYKMRWNPDVAAEKNKRASHQYATHVQWATIQARNMYNIYQNFSHYLAVFEIPQFLK